MTGKQLALLLTAAAALSAGGCMKPPPTRMQFNERIAIAVAKLAVHGKALRKTLEGLGKGTDVSVATVTPEVEKLGKTLDAIDAQFQDQLLPGKPSASAPAYLAAFEAFLKVEKQLYAVNVKQNILGTLQAPGLSPKDKWNRCEPELPP